MSDRLKSPAVEALVQHAVSGQSRGHGAQGVVARPELGHAPGRPGAGHEAPMQGRAQPAVDQRGLAGARGAHHGQEASLGQRVHHDIDLLLAAEKQVFLFFAKRSQPRVGIHRSVDGRWAHRGAGGVRCDDPHKGLHRLFREAIQAVDQVGLIKRQQEFLIVRGRASEVGVLGEERLVTLTVYLLELALLVEFPGLVSRPVKQDDAITTHIQLLVGLSDLRGISGEDGERDLEPPGFQKLQQGNDVLPVPLDAEDVNQLAAGFGKGLVGGFRLLGLFQLLQRGVDRAFQLLEVAGDQVRARLHLGILMKGVDEGLLGRLPGAGPLGEPDHAWQPAALAAPGRDLVLQDDHRFLAGPIGDDPVAGADQMNREPTLRHEALDLGDVLLFIAGSC